MKKMNLILLLFTGMAMGTGLVFGQSSAASSKEVFPVNNEPVAEPSQTQQEAMQDEPFPPESEIIMPQRGIPMPKNVEELLLAGKSDEAVAAFETYKSSLRRVKKSDLMFLELMVYDMAAHFTMTEEPDSAYLAKTEEIRAEIIKKYPKLSDTYLLQVTPEDDPEKIIEFATKAIDADETNEYAYEMRASALYRLEKTKEACLDLEKVSFREIVPWWYDTCRPKE